MFIEIYLLLTFVCSLVVDLEKRQFEGSEYSQYDQGLGGYPDPGMGAQQPGMGAPQTGTPGEKKSEGMSDETLGAIAVGSTVAAIAYPIAVSKGWVPGPITMAKTVGSAASSVGTTVRDTYRSTRDGIKGARAWMRGEGTSPESPSGSPYSPSGSPHSGEWSPPPIRRTQSFPHPIGTLSHRRWYKGFTLGH